jgi:hypothetical protein
LGEAFYADVEMMRDATRQHSSFNLIHFGQREDLNIGMQVNLRHFGGFDADGTIQCGEILVKDSHYPPNGSLFLNENDMRSRLCQVKGGLDTCNATAYNED